MRLGERVVRALRDGSDGWGFSRSVVAHAPHNTYEAPGVKGAYESHALRSNAQRSRPATSGFVSVAGCGGSPHQTRIEADDAWKLILTLMPSHSTGRLVVRQLSPGSGEGQRPVAEIECQVKGEESGQSPGSLPDVSCPRDHTSCSKHRSLDRSIPLRALSWARVIRRLALSTLNPIIQPFSSRRRRSDPCRRRASA